MDTFRILDGQSSNWKDVESTGVPCPIVDVTWATTRGYLYNPVETHSTYRLKRPADLLTR